MKLTIAIIAVILISGVCTLNLKSSKTYLGEKSLTSKAKIANVLAVIIDVQNDFVLEPFGKKSFKDAEKEGLEKKSTYPEVAQKIIDFFDYINVDEHRSASILTGDAHPENHISFKSSNKTPKEKCENADPITKTTCTIKDSFAEGAFPKHAIVKEGKPEIGQRLIKPLETILSRKVEKKQAKGKVTHETKYIALKGKDPYVDSFSAFGNNDGQNDLFQYISSKSDRFDTLVVFGYVTDICVSSTAFDALFLKHVKLLPKLKNVIVVEDLSQPTGAPDKKSPVGNISAELKTIEKIEDHKKTYFAATPDPKNSLHNIRQKLVAPHILSLGTFKNLITDNDGIFANSDCVKKLVYHDKAIEAKNCDDLSKYLERK